jgi:isoleucyl-tRNA synthetase
MAEKQQTQKQNPFSKMEEDVLDFWKKNKIFEKSVDKDAPKGDYVFYDGPPFATGLPHYGHLVGNIIKDVVPRYQTMKGYRVERKWGWDCHGLPIENIVEKEMGSQSKKDIESIGIDKFNESCRAKVLGYVDEWKKTITKLGRWADMENSYKTMDLDFMESVWWVFKELWEKDLIYKGYRSMHVCPRCETTLSQSEVAEGYRDIKDLSAIAKFELQDEPGTYVLAWTTTPWTLIGNVALAISDKEQYIRFKVESSDNPDFKIGETYILMEQAMRESMRDYFNGTPVPIDQSDLWQINSKNGKVLVKDVLSIDSSELINKKYKPLFDYYAKDENLENKENGWKIYGADFVTAEEGTGIVHIAPAFGDDDMKLGEENKLPFVQHVNMDGSIKSEAKDFNGMNVKPKENHIQTDIEIIKYLAHNNLLFHKEKYEHSYPHCWRCDTPLINYATASYFVNIIKIKKDLLKNAQEIYWMPEHMKDGRFGKWLEGARDWSISRQRFWASVIPIWECECGEIKVIGSVKELEALSGQKISDLHKHYVDDIVFPCQKCQAEMKRIPDVLDCWFESGSMPYAQMHYPFENTEKFEKNFPAEFIGEGVDQTRAWFYYLHAIATGIKNKPAFKNVVVNGIVLAEDGKKMAKKLQNYPDPIFIFEKYGADALRHYLLTSSVMLADTLCFSEKGVSESLRKINMMLWNVYKFYELFRQEHKSLEIETESKNILDRWIIAKLNILLKTVTENMEKYNLPQASRPVADFIDDFSTWYLRRSRDRFKGEDEADKKAALQTTAYVLLQTSKAIAPFMPFIAEQVWQKVTGNDFKNKNKSVHLENWPLMGEINIAVIEEMDKVRRIVELGLAKRDEAGIRVRQPLGKFSIFNPPDAEKGFKFSNDYYLELIKDELNVKELIMEKGSGELKVELDTEITPELKQEGIKRELVRFINNLRKDAGLTIYDRVNIFYQTDSGELENVLKIFSEELKKDTLAENIFQGILENSKEVKIDGLKTVLGVEKI